MGGASDLFDMGRCDICGDEHSEESESCEACHKVISKYQNNTKYSMREVRKALKDAYSHKDTKKKESYFRCAYTGMVGNFNSQDRTLHASADALILSMDHKNPNSDELAVSLNIINKMKVDIPSDDFKDVVRVLGEYFAEENDRNFKKLEKELKQKFG